MLCRDAGSFWAGDVCHRPSFWIDRRFRSPGEPAVPVRRDTALIALGGGSPNPTSIGSPIVERKPDGDFDLLMFGRNKVPRWFYLMSCFMVAVRASLSSFWILVSKFRTTD